MFFCLLNPLYDFWNVAMFINKVVTNESRSNGFYLILERTSYLLQYNDSSYLLNIESWPLNEKWTSLHNEITEWRSAAWVKSKNETQVMNQLSSNYTSNALKPHVKKIQLTRLLKCICWFWNIASYSRLIPAVAAAPSVNIVHTAVTDQAFTVFKTYIQWQRRGLCALTVRLACWTAAGL